MSTFKETLKNNQLNLEDEKITRLKKIQNQNKREMLSNALWNQSQSELYPNSLLLHQSPSVNEVLISQYKNDMTNRDTATNYLSKITSDVPRAEHIVERLTTSEVFSLNQQIQKITREF